jgi:F0F1-type ATP synthase assembly protein I
MIKTELSLPELGLIAGTRALLGAGIGLLLADKLGTEKRMAVGWTLVGVGALTTIPLVIDVFAKRTDSGHGSSQSDIWSPS